MGWIKVRTIMLVAAMAALLSILIAGINGVPLLRLLFRALLSGILFGGLAVGIAWLVQQFLPELLEQEEEQEDSPPTVEVGGHLDIKDDQEPASPQVSDAQNIVKAAQEEEPQEEDEPALEAEKPKIKPLAGEEPDFQQNSNLPDIENFSGDFSPDDIPGESQEANDTKGKGPSSSASLSGAGLESTGSTMAGSDDQARSYFTEHSTPEEMAKAVRTVVKRDEE